MTTKQLENKLTKLNERIDKRKAELDELRSQQKELKTQLADAKKAELKFGDKYPEIPAVPSEFEQLNKKVVTILDHLAEMPLPQLVADLRKAVQDVDKLVASDSVKKAADNLGPLLESLTQTSNAAQATLKSADQMMDPSMRYEIARLLRQLTEISRSVRVLSNYLEQHPEALIKGKGSPSKP